MKKTLVHLLFALFTMLATAQLPQKGLLFHFPFNGSVWDVGPNKWYPNIITTKSGGVTLESDRNNSPSSCYSFTGGYIDMGMDEKMAVKDSSFTFLAWVIATSSNGATTIFSNNYGFFWGFSVGMNNGSVYAAVTGGSMPNSISVKVDYDINLMWYDWQHIAVVLNRSTNKFYIYVNGIKRPIANDTSLGPYGGTITGNELDFTGLPLNLTTLNGNVIGAYLAGGKVYQNFLGKIDDIALYNRALTESEISAVYAGSTALHPNTSSRIFLNLKDGIASIKGLTRDAELTVFDLKGVKVTSSVGQYIHINSLPKGIYFLKINDGNTSFTEKFSIP